MAAMTDADLQAWLDAHGGEVGRKDNEAEADDPTHTAPLAPGEKRRQTKTVESTTVTAKDGATITLRRATGWSASPGGPQYDVTANTPPTRQVDPSERAVKEKKPVRDPNSPTGWTEEITYEDGRVTRNVGIKSPEDKPAAPATVATNTTEPFIVTRQPDGSLTQEDNPNYRGADPKPGATHFSVGGDGRTYAIPIDAQGHPGQAVDVGLPPKPTEAQSPYSQVQQDPDTKKWYGLKRDGKGWEEIPGGPGAATSSPAGSAPPLPAMVIGASQAALREYHAALQREVASGRRTDAWAQARFTEAMAVARQTVDEANVVNNEAQSRRNADVSLMNNRQNAATTGFGQALDTVNAGNKYLPKGSTLGGEAFRALLGLQRGHAERMGAYTDPYGSQTGAGAAPGAPGAVPGAQAAPLPASAPPSAAAVPLMLTVRNKVTGETAQVLSTVFQTHPDREKFTVIDAQSLLGFDAPPVGPSAPAVPPAVDPASIGAPPAGPAGGSVQVAPPVVAPPAAAPVAPPAAPAGNTITLHHPGTGETWTITRQEYESRQNTLRMSGWVEVPPSAAPVTQAAPQEDFAVLANAMGSMAPSDEMPGWTSQPGVPERGPTAPPPPGASLPVYPDRDGPLPYHAPWGDGGFQTIPAPTTDGTPIRHPQIPEPMPFRPLPAEPEPFAMMAARIRSTPPWRLSQNDLNQFVAAGGDPADFWSDGITGGMG